MSAITKIDWCDATWNPINGCTKISEGCKNCYAERMAKRFWSDRPFSEVQFNIKHLLDPLHWRKPRKIFVGSMGDLFHEDINYFQIKEIINIMQYKAPQHTYIILTKRAERMIEIINKMYFRHQFPKNIWLGVSAENQEQAEKRIPLLYDLPANIKFVSLEPLLSGIDLGVAFGYVDWVICGCESGPGARPAESWWFDKIAYQCFESGTPLFIKQMKIDGKLVKMPEVLGMVWNQFPNR